VWFATPVEGIASALRQGPDGATFLVDAMAGVALILGFLGIWLLDRLNGQPRPTASGAGGVVTIPASWGVYTVGVLLVAYSAYFTDSIPRYTMAAFPLFVAFAWRIPARLTGVVVGVMAFFQGALLVAALMVAVHPVLVPLVP
jgi:hypothetical protein